MMNLLEELATLAQLGEPPHARQKCLLQEPVHNFCDLWFLAGLLCRDVLEPSQVLIEVDLINADAAVQIFIRVNEV